MKTDLQPKLNWDIRLEPVILNKSFDTGKKAIIRNDTNQLLSIVGKHYEPVTNSQLMHFTDALTKSGEFELKGFDELNDGKIVMAFLKNTNPNLKINGCSNEEYMFVGNSFDGTKRFHIGTASNLIRCSNQWSATLKVFNKKHTSYLDINDTIAQDIIRNYKAKKGTLYESFDGMESVRVDESVITRLIKEVHLMLATDSKLIKQKDWKTSPSMVTLHKSIEREMKDLGNNAFGLFNGVTWYTTHEMRTADSVNSQINGTANLINQKAFRFCNNLKRNNNQSI
jgi:hypothetical protein